MLLWKGHLVVKKSCSAVSVYDKNFKKAAVLGRLYVLLVYTNFLQNILESWNVFWLFSLILGLGNVWSVCTRLERLGRPGTYGERLGSRLRLKTLLLVVVGFRAGSFFFGVVYVCCFPILPRFSHCTWSFLGVMTFLFVVVFVFLRPLNFLVFFDFCNGGWGVLENLIDMQVWCYKIFEGVLRCVRGTSLVTCQFLISDAVTVRSSIVVVVVNTGRRRFYYLILLWRMEYGRIGIIVAKSVG
jgi:hypothetical protein